MSSLATERSESVGGRLLPWIAAERVLRSLVLITVGIVLVTHAHTDWGRAIADAAKATGLDPSRNGIRRITTDAQQLSGPGAAGDRELQQGAVPFASHRREQLIPALIGDRPRRTGRNLLAQARPAYYGLGLQRAQMRQRTAALRR